MKPLLYPQVSLCSGVKYLLFLSLLLLQPVGSVAAAEGAAEKPRVSDWSEVGVIDVAPVQRAIALLAPNAQTPPKPAALGADQRLQILAAASGSENDDPGSVSATAAAGKTIVLSAANTVYEDQGVLTLVQPFTVHPETGIHMRGSEPGSVGVKVNVEEGSRYLVDFLVRAAVPGHYQLDAEGESRVIEDEQGDREHVLLVLRAGSSGWSTVRLRRPDSDFFLYAVEITRFE